MTNKYMKNCPASLTIREMQTNVTLKSCLMSMKMITIKKKNCKFCQGFEEKGCEGLIRILISIATVDISMHIYQKIKI